jgi:hypothetical protein
MITSETFRQSLEEETQRPGHLWTQEGVDKVSATLLAKEANSAGCYIRGKLNPDRGGASFRYTRPGLRLRIEVFILATVPDVLSDPVTSQEDDASDEDEDTEQMTFEDVPGVILTTEE